MPRQVSMRLWVQNPPRVEWCLKVRVEDGDTIATARTWFTGHPVDREPDPRRVEEAAVMLERVAVAAMASPSSAHYSIEIAA